MSEKIFILCQDDLGNYEIRYDDKIFHFLWEIAPILNEQQSIIEQLQGENEQLKHWNKCLAEKRHNEKKNCGHCKHFQIDGMFGLWCDKNHNWELVNGNCSDFER